jgi:hypothetical protein
MFAGRTQFAWALLQTGSGDGTAADNDPTAGYCCYLVPYDSCSQAISKEQTLEVRYRGKEIEFRIIETKAGSGKRRRAAEGDQHVALHHVVNLADVMRGRSLTHNLALYRKIRSEMESSGRPEDREKGKELRERMEPLIETAMRAAARADSVRDPSSGDWAEVAAVNANRDIVHTLGELMNDVVWAPGDGNGPPLVETEAATEPREPAPKKPRLPVWAGTFQVMRLVQARWITKKLGFLYRHQGGGRVAQRGGSADCMISQCRSRGAVGVRENEAHTVRPAGITSSMAW